ncbi:sperm-associated microtubule inner protein 4-like isoform X2 [Rhopilema esculentum]|uniref:sperm-associated microtubule inner protein 4-like isoform X2 n=1 Tax=Rhopilema esculentum TaxID=499914 RepID=UPI0031DC02D5
MTELSPTFQSNLEFTPGQLKRPTISQENFKRYFNATPKVPKTPWGRHLSYGGMGPISLPSSNRPKGEPPVRVEKGHLHYGAGVMPHPSAMTIQQFYTLTPLSKSNVRTNDQLIPAPNKENLGTSKIEKKFPAEHPYSSHSSRFALFPQFDVPTDMSKGDAAHLFQPTLPPETAASAPEASIIGKAKGTPARHERVSVSPNSSRSPLRWLDGPNYFQLPKGPDKERQNYYPCPPSTVRPASGKVLENTSVSLRTASTLNDLQKSMWISTYGKDFKGSATLDTQNAVTDNSKTSAENFIEAYTPFCQPDKSRVSSASTTIRSKSRADTELPETRDAEFFDSRRLSDATTPKSVQFNRSVTFSDGMSIREIPLTSGSDTLGDKRRDFLKTPFNKTRILPGTANSDSASDLLQRDIHVTDRLSRSAPASTSINHMPSQIAQKDILKGDPACPLKYFRPHTVGSYRSTTDLLNVHDRWSKSAASRRFHEAYPEPTPDLRRKPDLRFTTNEKRHVVPEAKAHTYIFRGADHL